MITKEQLEEFYALCQTNEGLGYSNTNILIKEIERLQAALEQKDNKIRELEEEFEKYKKEVKELIIRFGLC